MKNLKNKIISSFLVALLSFSTISASAATLAPGIEHEATSTTWSGNIQKVNKISVDLTNPYSKIEYGISTPINTLKSVSALAKLNTYEQHHVVGAVNASFFRFDNRMPSYLLSQQDKIVNLGNVSTNFNDFMYVPAAFGVTADNVGKIGKYNLTHTIEYAGTTFTASSMNRYRKDNEIIVYTSSWQHSKTKQNAFGYEVVVAGVTKKVDSELSYGEKVTGVVTAIRPYGQITSASIPEDGFVLSANGTESEKLRNMQIGEEVSLTIDIDEEWKGSQFMLASGPLLVQDGQSALTMDIASPRARERAPRTAVATDITGEKVFLVTVDGRQKGYSTGMTLVEFSKYLVSIGAYAALNLDGGGSTAMVTRRYGTVYPTLVNKPSDGSERAVSAILQAISIAPYGNPVSVKVSPTEEGILAVGASVGFKLENVIDEYYNSLPLDSSKFVLETVTNDIGKIENGRFVATKAGIGVIQAKYDTFSFTIPVTVTSTVDQLVATPNEIVVPPNGQTSITVKGMKSGKPVILASNSLSWNSVNTLGQFAANIFTANNLEGTSTLTGTYGNTTVKIPVTVTTKPFPLQVFDSMSEFKVESVKAASSLKGETKLQPKAGKISIQLAYDFSKYKKGTSAAYLTWKTPSTVPGNPKKLGMWVYGDGTKRWLRGNVIDSKGKLVTIDFTKDDQMNWVGWKYVEATIPSTVSKPIKLSKVYVAETSEKQKTKGAIWVDHLQAIYQDGQTEVVAFAPSGKAPAIAASASFTVAFKEDMNVKQFTNQYVYVEDTKGNRIPVTVKTGTNAKQLVVLAPKGGYNKDKNYRVVATHLITNKKGTRMTQDRVAEFKVK